MNVEILHEDQEIIVAVKPAGMLSQADRSSAMDMVSYLKNKTRSYIALIHRLDRPVGGVMVFAKTPQAAKVLSNQLARHQMNKRYLAVLHGRPAKTQGECSDYLLKDGKTNLSRIADKNEPKAKEAKLKYKIVNSRYVGQKIYSLAEIELLTGRHHQIRVQMAGLGHGICGDTKYNPDTVQDGSWVNIGLFACELSFQHPKTRKNMTFKHQPSHAPFDLFL